MLNYHQIQRKEGREEKQEACFPDPVSSDIICSELSCCLTKQMFLLKYLTMFSKNLLLLLKFIVTQLSGKVCDSGGDIENNGVPGGIHCLKLL